MAGKEPSKKNQPLWKKLLIMIVSGAFGAGAVMPLGPLLKGSGSPLVQWLRDSPLGALFIPAGLILTILVCFVAAVGLHEVGHVIAGNSAGFRFAFLLFWPFQVRRSGEKGLTVRTLFRSGLGMGGLAGMTPKPGVDLRRGYLTLLAGGPAASLTGAILGIGSYVLLRQSLGLVSGFGWCFGVCSLLLFIISMNPSQAAGFLSDGAAIRLLRKGTPEEVGPYLATMELSSAWSTGVRPADWNPDAITRILAVSPDDPLSRRGPYFAFLNAADRGDLIEARQWMDKLNATMDEVPVLLRPQYHLMNAWLTAREGSAVAARELLPKGQGGLTDACEFAMVDAVVLQAEGKIDEARSRAREALALFEKSMMPDAHEFARHQCESILA